MWTIRASTSALFKAPPAEYIRTAWKAASLGAGATTALVGMATLRATGRATARDAATAVRIKPARNIFAIWTFLNWRIYPKVRKAKTLSSRLGLVCGAVD